MAIPTASDVYPIQEPPFAETPSQHLRRQPQTACPSRSILPWAAAEERVNICLNRCLIEDYVDETEAGKKRLRLQSLTSQPMSCMRAPMA